jgi:hypothetical protein
MKPSERDRIAGERQRRSDVEQRFNEARRPGVRAVLEAADRAHGARSAHGATPAAPPASGIDAETSTTHLH